MHATFGVYYILPFKFFDQIKIDFWILKKLLCVKVFTNILGKFKQQKKNIKKKSALNHYDTIISEGSCDTEE